MTNTAQKPPKEKIFILIVSLRTFHSVTNTMSTSHEPPKTYLVAPNFTTKPGGAIKLGNVLANPLLPHLPIAFLERNQCPEVHNAFDTNPAVNRSADGQARLSVSTKVFRVIGTGAGIDKSRHVTRKYTMASLKTEAFSGVLPRDTIKELLENDEVKRTMRFPSFSRSVYVISGIKTAESFCFERHVSKHAAANVEASAKPTQEIEIAAQAVASQETTESDDLRPGQDIVLAYQLFKISRSLLHGFTQKEYHPGPKGEFLGAEDPHEQGDAVEDHEFDCALVTPDDLSKELGKRRVLQDVYLQENNGGLSCVLEENISSK